MNDEEEDEQSRTDLMGIRDRMGAISLIGRTGIYISAVYVPCDEALLLMLGKGGREERGFRWVSRRPRWYPHWGEGARVRNMGEMTVDVRGGMLCIVPCKSPHTYPPP